MLNDDFVLLGVINQRFDLNLYLLNFKKETTYLKNVENKIPN